MINNKLTLVGLPPGVWDNAKRVSHRGRPSNLPGNPKSLNLRHQYRSSGECRSTAKLTLFLAAILALLAPSAALSGQYLNAYVSVDDGAASASENAQKLPHPESEDLSSKTLADLIRWIADNTDYDVDVTMQSPPQIRFSSIGDSIRYEGKDIFVDEELLAAYDRIDRVIYIVRPWNLSNPENLSRVLHELIHDVQFQNVEWPCLQKPEWQTYKLQAQWLAEHAVEKEFDWSKIFLMSQCPEDVLPMTQSRGRGNQNDK